MAAKMSIARRTKHGDELRIPRTLGAILWIITAFRKTRWFHVQVAGLNNKTVSLTEQNIRQRQTKLSLWAAKK